MSYPVPIVECEACECRFVLEPAALVEDVALDEIHTLCRTCRDCDAELDGRG